MAKKRRKVAKDKKTGVPKKYLSGLKKKKNAKNEPDLLKESQHYIKLESVFQEHY